MTNPRASKQLVLALALVGLVTLVIMLISISRHYTDRMVVWHIPQINAMHELRQHVTLAHLWLEEVLHGDPHETPAKVWHNLSAADWLADALLDGGSNDHLTIAPLEEARMRQSVMATQDLLATLNSLTGERLKSPDITGPGSDIDEQLDGVFQSALLEVRQLEHDLHEHIQQDLNYFQHIQNVLILLSLLSATLLLVVFYRSHRKLARALEKEKMSYQALQLSEERFRDIAHCGGDWIWEVGPKGEYTYASESVEEVIGYTPDEVLGHTPFDFMPATEKLRVSSEFNRLIAAKAEITELENWNRTKDGRLVCLSTSGIPILDAEGKLKGYRGVDRDITVQKQQQQLILKQAHFDSLTGLPNRFLSLDRLSHAIAKAIREEDTMVSVLFLDLDDFKKVNDTLGHATGDEILIQAAKRLARVIRAGDTVGRLGGDEFVIILGGTTDIEDSRLVAEKLLWCFKRPFDLQDRQVKLTASIGIACYPGDGMQADDLLRKADTAMYQSKARGRNTYHFFTDSMNQQVSRRLAVENALHKGLQRGELRVEYQPVMELAGNTCVGAEALLRWNNALMGEMSPDEFVAVAEQTGYIVTVGKFVLQEALDFLAAWRHRSGQELSMAVNISPGQFRDPGLGRDIESALQHARLPASALQLEITEHVMLKGNSDMAKVLESMSELGVSIAMDDYGTGFSSLNNLRDYPFAILKIDRSFIHEIKAESAEGDLINATIAMAHGLGLKVVAEGVESQQQLDFLRQHGCDYAQGYLFCGSLTGDQLLEKYS